MLCFNALYIQKYRWSPDVSNALHTENYITQNTNMLRIHVLYLVSTLFGMICCLFSKCNTCKLYYTASIPIITFYLSLKCTTFFDRCRKKGNLWIFFSFKIPQMDCSREKFVFMYLKINFEEVVFLVIFIRIGPQCPIYEWHILEPELKKSQSSINDLTKLILIYQIPDLGKP